MRVTHVVIGYVKDQGWTAAAYRPKLDIVKGVMTLELAYNFVDDSPLKAFAALLEVLKKEGWGQ